jgi:biopolymer transport protein ExbB
MLAGVVGDAEAWWNDQWQFRKKITIDASASGADIRENLGNFPLLVRLHTGNYGFQFGKDNGDDIRFVSADDKAVLKHHIEKFDPIEEAAQVWVKVPAIAAGSGQNFIWLYYGNKNAAGAQDAAQTYDPNEAAVFHFSESEGNPKDASSHQNHAVRFSGGQGLPGVSGLGVALNGGTDLMAIGPSDTLALTNGATFTAWVRLGSPQAGGTLLYREEAGNRWAVRIDGTAVSASLVKASGEKAVVEKAGDITIGSWHHVAVTLEPNKRMIVYIDGAEVGQAALPWPLPPMKAETFVGNTPAGNKGLVAELDEVTLSATFRPAGWIKALFESQGLEAKLLSVSADEKGEASNPFIDNLKIIVRNISFDGWAIIGILALQGIVITIVFVSKLLLLGAVEKENRRFFEDFAGKSWAELGKEEESYQNSTLFSVFARGKEQLLAALKNPNLSKVVVERAGNPEPERERKVLNSKGVNAVKIAGERGYVEETRKLNSNLVQMTIAIAGAPFLGLLGTVWGIMNTFAAMAEAGEANLAAIAPGIASALACTISGLIIALPALFGYNFLTSKIKDITAEMGMFIDEFTNKVEELHGGI